MRFELYSDTSGRAQIVVLSYRSLVVTNSLTDKRIILMMRKSS